MGAITRSCLPQGDVTWDDPTATIRCEVEIPFLDSTPVCIVHAAVTRGPVVANRDYSPLFLQPRPCWEGVLASRVQHLSDVPLLFILFLS